MRNGCDKDIAPDKRLSGKHFRDFGIGISDVRSILRHHVTTRVCELLLNFYLSCETQHIFSCVIRSSVSLQQPAWGCNSGVQLLLKFRRLCPAVSRSQIFQTNSPHYCPLEFRPTLHFNPRYPVRCRHGKLIKCCLFATDFILAPETGPCKGLVSIRCEIREILSVFVPNKFKRISNDKSLLS